MDDKTEDKQTPKDAGEGIQSKTPTLIDEANTAAQRLETANERKAELLRQEEELDAKKVLGGRAEGGQEIKQEFSDEEKASRARIKAVGDASGSPWAKNYE
jgi:hypothetical protein